MKIEYIKQRVNELWSLIEQLRDSATEDTKVANDLILKIRESKDEDEKIELMKKFKKTQFFNNLKLSEMEKTMPVLVELVSLAKVVDVDLELTDEQESIIDTNKKRITPMYIVDKNQLVFVHKELEEAVDKEINNPSESDLAALKNIFKAVENGN